MTRGMVKYLFATVNIDCPGVGKRALFKDQIITTKMGEKGDSGSLLLNENNYAVGLYVGSSNEGCMFNHIQEVLTSLNVKLVID